MAINLSPIYTRFIQFINNTVGDRLQYHPGQTTYKAIYIKKDNNEKGVYPFATVGINAINLNSQRSLVEYYNSNGELVTGSIWDLVIPIAIYSSDRAVKTKGFNYSAESIALDLSSKLTSRKALSFFNDLGEITKVNNITTSNFKRDGEVGEAAIFYLQFSMYQENVDTGDDYDYDILTIAGGLNYKYDPDEENNIIDTFSKTKP